MHNHLGKCNWWSYWYRAHSRRHHNLATKNWSRFASIHHTHTHMLTQSPYWSNRSDKYVNKVWNVFYPLSSSVHTKYTHLDGWLDFLRASTDFCFEAKCIKVLFIALHPLRKQTARRKCLWYSVPLTYADSTSTALNQLCTRSLNGSVSDISLNSTTNCRYIHRIDSTDNYSNIIAAVRFTNKCGVRSCYFSTSMKFKAVAIQDSFVIAIVHIWNGSTVIFKWPRFVSICVLFGIIANFSLRKKIRLIPRTFSRFKKQILVSCLSFMCCFFHSKHLNAIQFNSFYFICFDFKVNFFFHYVSMWYKFVDCFE